MINYNKDVLFIQDYVFNSSIIEYDIQSAGLTILSNSGQLTEQQINDLSNMSKNSRVVSIGLMIRDNPEYQKILNAGYIDARKGFIESNNLQESDVICIKKDALFTTVQCKVLDINGVKFRAKTKWRSYLKLGRIEFFFADKSKYQVQGLGDIAIDYHRDDWISTIVNIIDRVSNADRSVRNYIMSIVDKYKKGELPERYYHVLKADPSQYDEAYNYREVLIPLMQILAVI